MADPLAGLILQIRLLAEAALVRRLNAGSGFADPRLPSQIYLRDEAAQGRLAGGTLRPKDTHRKAEAELATLAQQTPRTAPRFDTLATRLGLDPAANSVAAIAVAYGLDLDTRELCHALASRRRPALYLETCVDLLRTPPATLLRTILPGAPLRRGRVIAVDGDGLAASIEPVATGLAWLLGDDALQLPLAGLAELVPTDDPSAVVLPGLARAALDALVPRLTAGDLAVLIRGPRGSGRRASAYRLAAAISRPLFVIPAGKLVALEHRSRSALLGTALAAARLRDAVPFLADVDALFDERGELVAEHADALANYPGLVIAGTAKGGGHLELGRAVLSVALPRTELDDRERAWTAALGPHGLQADAVELAARYVIGPGAIADVAVEAARFAPAAGTAVDPVGLEAAVARRLSLRVGTFGAVVQRKARFAELVLPTTWSTR